ncbi:probable chitinase 10 [Neocloeon triangulifer]|uniref:probable chitinase 10 n=1 Tax=Neocloeon triangulifer TaxID=2078957 RepID=UPI00286F00BB|nr:probable chitinase 10 [Neocloeon triangulifer]
MGGLWLLAACVLLAFAPGAPQFQRGAVEHMPERQNEFPETSQVLEKIQLPGLGTRRLPLRAAVEHHLTAQERAQQHIPLREAVESRPFGILERQQAQAYSAEKELQENQEIDDVNAQIPGQERYPIGISPISDYRVVCYLESWAAHRREPMKFFTKEFNPFACTHLIYAFASLDPHTLKIVPQDEEFDIVKGGYKAVMQLKEVNPSLKVMVSVGGWVEAARRFSEMASSASSRREFIRSVVHFLDEHNFDGLDLFWEFPGAKDLGAKASDRDNLVLLAEALAEVFAPKGRLLSAAVASSRFRIEDGYDVPQLARHVDFFNVMSYDLLNERDKAAYHPSPLYRRAHDQGIGVFLNVDYAIQYWLRKGAPSRKLTLGLPFFGRTFTLQDANVFAPGSPISGPGTEGKYTLQRGFMSYFEICEKLAEGNGGERWMEFTDEVGSPYMVKGNQWIGYDDPKSVKNKMDYVKKYNLGGAMVWAVDMDDFLGFCGRKYPLLSAVNEGLKATPSQKPVTSAPVVAAPPPPPPTRPPVEAVEAGEAAMVVPTPGQEIVTIGPGNSCKGHGYAREPTNCRVYYRCEWGVKTTYVCPEGLHYDAALNLCNWPEMAGCEQVVLIPEKYVLTPLQQFLLRFALPYYPTQHNTMISQQQQVGVDCSSDGLYSDPSSQSYVLCQNQKSFAIRCPQGTVYSVQSNLCEQQVLQPVVKSAAQQFEQLKIDEHQSPNALDGRKEKGYKVVCYFTNWAWYRKDDAKFVPEHLDSRLCTHIVYAFAALEPHDLRIISSDTWTDLENNFYQRVTSIPEPRRGDSDVKVLLSLGGWTDSSGDKYSRLVNDPSARRKFVAESVAFLRSHNFGGLHVDWHYPRCWQSNCGKGPASDRPNFAQLVKELRAEFSRQSPPLELAVAISGYKEVLDVAYDVAEISRNVDFMSVMTYDYHGAWEGRTGHVSPLFYRQGDRFPQYNTNFTLEHLVAMGADREKVIMGIPLYGQSYTLDTETNNDVGAPTFGPGEPGEFTQQPGMLAYFEICERVHAKKWKVVRDKFGAHGPYAYSGDQWVGYEDIDSIKEKGRYIRNMGFGGAMVWTVDLDDFTNRCCKGPFPLLRAINRIFDRVPADMEPTQDCKKPPQPVTPASPTLTTGVDTGAESTTTPMSPKPIQVSTTSPSTTSPSTTSPSTTSPSTTTHSWTTTSSTTTTSTTSRPTTPTPSTTTASTTQVTWWPQSSSTQQPGSSTWWPQATTEAPQPAPVANPPGGDGELLNKACEPGEHHPDRNNCNGYYRCIQGKLKREFCAGGLHWNPTLHACDWPRKAGCQADQNVPTTSAPWWPQQPPTVATTTTTTERPNEWWTPSTETSQQIVEGRPTTSAPPKSCVSGSYDANPSDCGKFFICVNGRQTSQNCATGLHWNQDKKYCDWPSNVQCQARISPDVEIVNEFGAEESDELRLFKGEACSRDFMRDPADCSVFYRCENGKVLSVEHCADGLHFNEEQRHCDWPASAGCKSSGDSSAATTKRPSPATVNLPAPEHSWTPPPKVEVTTVAAPTVVADPAPAPCTGKCLMVCYFTNWAWYRQGVGKYFPEDIDPALCTHIVYGFAVLDYENLIIKMHDSWADVDNRFYERVTEFKKHGKKVLIAIGGWNDSAGDKYSRLVNSPAARKRFIKHVIEFMQKYNFDGLDLDWEYPKCWQVNCDKGPDSDKQAFADFIRELRAEFDAAGSYLLTAAVSPSKTVVDAGYDVPAVGKYLDYVSVMTYDFHGHWDKKTGHVAPLYEHEDDDFYFFNANYSINYWNQQGVPKCKLIMGMPLYGQSFTLSKPSENGLNAPATGPGQAGEYTRAAGFLSYYEICDKIKNKGYTVVNDPEGRMGPYAYKDRDWVSFDDIKTLTKKAQFVANMGLGGSMIWALDLDDFKGTACGQGKYPLLTAINSHMCSASVVSDTSQQTSKPSKPEVVTSAPSVPPTAFQPDEIPTKAPAMAPTVAPTKAPIQPKPQPVTLTPGAVTPGPGTDVATCGGSTSPCGPYKVVCYFTNWAWYRQGNGKYLPSDIDASLCTHIVYGFAVLDTQSLLVKPHDSWADLDNKFYEKVVAYKAKGLKVLLAIGGWNDSAGDKYSRLVNNPSARARFIDHVIKFIDEYGFDGLDLDWEYPVCWQVDCKKGPASDKAAFSAFVQELRAKFGPDRLLSAAVSPSKYVVDAGYDVPALSQNLDWIAVMTYDYHGQWDKRTGHVAPMYAHPDDADATFNTNFTINYWIKNGASPCKIVMGMPMYGQSFSLAETTNTGLNVPTYGGGEAGDETRARGFLSYYEICQRIKSKGWQVVQDPLKTMGPYAYLRDQWVSFDDQAMIKYKVDFIRQMGLAGGMIWALDLDDFRNLCGCEAHPLLKTINRGLCRIDSPAPDCSFSSRFDVEEDDDAIKMVSASEEETNPNDLREDTCSHSGLQKHPGTCSKYVECVNGVKITRNCPPGTVFILDKQNCGWAAKDSTCLPQENEVAEVATQAPQAPQQEQKPVVPMKPKPQPVTERPVFPPQTGGGKQCSDEFVPQPNDMKVICYFTNWAIYRPGIGKYRAEDIDTNLCTHVLYGFAVLDGSTLTIKSHDPWADFDDGLALYSKVSALRQKGVKVLLALGGWNDSLGDKYSRLVSTQSSRSRFIKQALDFIEKYKFEGLDLDWEYPKCWQVDCSKGPDADKENFAALVRELSAEFKPKGLLLSAAVSPSKMVIDAGYDVPTLSKYLDWISVMTYDYHGQWDKMTGHVAPFRVHENDTNVYFNVDYTLNYYIKKGADPKKLVMGIPLYAQSFTLIDQSNTGLDSKSSGPGLAGEFTRAAGFTAFYEVCHMVKQQQWTVVRDPSGAMGPYAYRGNQWMSYDDVDIIRDKMAFVKKLGISGAMIWALDLDDFTNRCGCGKYPLLRTINEELRGQGCKLNACT